MKAWYIRRIDHQESHFISCVLPTRSYYVTSHEVSASSAKALQFQQHSIAALFCRSCARAAKSWERRLFMSLWLVSFAQLKGLMLPATPYQTRWKATSTSLQCFCLLPLHGRGFCAVIEVFSWDLELHLPSAACSQVHTNEPSNLTDA